VKELDSGAETENKMVVDSAETRTQEKNWVIVKSLSDESEENIRIFSADMALTIYKQFKKKRVNPVTKFRGKLEISPNLSIDVCVYAKTMETKLPSLKKFSLATEFSETLDSGKIEPERIYFIHDDQDKNPISEELKIKGYFYGKSLVPIGKTEEALFKFNQDEKCLQAIGFTDSYKVPSINFI
jgi:hypothetical protein